MNKAKTLIASAPGKIILSGEHAVVYGYPAIVTAINKRLEISCDESVLTRLSKNLHKAFQKDFAKEMEISINSQIPIGSGLGSSAAYSVALSLLTTIQDSKGILTQAYEIEKLQHGNPSGVDTTISLHGGFMYYKKSESLKNFKPNFKIGSIILLNSGTPIESTKEMVSLVAKSFLKKKDTKKILAEIGQISEKLYECLSGDNKNNFLGLIQENEILLEKLGVVSQATLRKIALLRKEKIIAKVTGAGGLKNGSGVVICFTQDKEKLKYYSNKWNWDYLGEVSLGTEGAKLYSV